MSGAVVLSYAHEVGASRNKASYHIRAGDKLRIADFPGGARTFRIYEARHYDDQPSVLQIGDHPMRFERMMLWQAKKRERTGRG